MEKLKSAVSLKRAVQHNTRERKPPNADDDRSLNNWTSGGSSNEVMDSYQGKLPAKVRANAVHAIEVVMTFGKGYYGDVQNYLKDCGQWVEKVFGKENTLHVAHHWDETTPHVHALVMPLKDGKLNAKAFIGGESDRMAELQEDFYQNVGRVHGLDRGQPKAQTKARHTHHTLAGKAAELNERENVLTVKESKLDEREKKLQNFSGEFQNLIGMKPDDVRKLKTLVDNWDKATPASLRVIARDIEQSGAVTVGEYRKTRELEKHQTQTRKI